MNLKFISMIFAVSSIFTYSCVDDDYDLTKDIDLTISVGGSEFAIPGGMTEEIKLSKVLKLDDEELVKTDKGGNYFLEQNGDETESKIHIDGITIDAPDIDPIDLSVTNIDIPGISVNSGSRVVTEFINVSLPIGSASFELTKNDLPKELKSISYIATSATAKVQIKFSFPANQGLQLNALQLQDFILQFPQYIVSDKLNAECQLVLNGQTIEREKVFTVLVPIKGLDLSKLPENEGVDGEKHTLNISGEVSASGNVSINPQDIMGVGVAGSKLSFDLISDIDLGNITANAVTGVVKPDINIDIAPIQLKNIPDFLTDDEVKLDVQNPMIFLSTNNQTPLEATINGVFTSYRDDKQLAGPVDVSIPLIERMKDQRFCISPSGADIDGAKGIKANIAQLIYQIPDEIRFNIIAGTTDSESTINLNSDYFIKTDYNVDVPFIFGPSLSIVYKDTIDGWQKDLKKYDIQLVRATADVINKIPLALSFEAQAVTLGANDELVLLDGVIAKVMTNGNENDNTIKAGIEKDGTMTPIIIEIKETKAGSVKKLDGLILKATALSGQEDSGKQLNENQSIQLKNVKLKIPGGVKVDLN